MNKVRLNEPTIPYISNVTGTWITRDARRPVLPIGPTHANHTARFSDALHEMWQFKNPDSSRGRARPHARRAGHAAP